MTRTLVAGARVSLTENAIAETITIAVEQLADRERLTGGRTYYVRTNGNDSNNGLTDSAGGAFLTLQRAVNAVRDEIDLNGFDVFIQCGAGTYTAGALVDAPWAGEGTVTIQGDATTPTNCTVSVTGGDCFAVINGGRLNVRGFRVQTTTSGHGLKAYLRSTLSYDSINFGACAQMHVECGQGSTIIGSGNYTISGGSTGHWHCGSFGLIQMGSGTITLTGTPAFVTYFAGAAQGAIISSATFSGAATGQRFLAHKNAYIEAVGGTLTTFPGNADGATNTGGIYAGTDLPIFLQPFNGGNTELALRSRNFNAQTFTTHFRVTSELFGGFGYFYATGDDSYSSGRTHFGANATVDTSTGTADGWTFRSKALVDAGFSVFDASANGATVGSLRRRTSNGDVLLFRRDTTAVGSISVTATNTAYNTSSDYRLKDSPEDLTDSGAFIDALRPRVWTWKQTGERGVGFIAHELQEVSPSSVTGDKDAVMKDGTPQYQSVAYSSAEIIANLVAEVQALRQRVAVLEAA